MGKPDIRKELRFPADLLPDKYSAFTVLLPNEQKVLVTTIDASLIGFGFVSDLPSELFVIGTKIVLYPLGMDKPIYARIIFSKQIDNLSRVGVQLLEIGHYMLYRKDILEICERSNQ